MQSKSDVTIRVPRHWGIGVVTIRLEGVEARFNEGMKRIETNPFNNVCDGRQWPRCG